MSPPLGVYICVRCSRKLQLIHDRGSQPGLIGWLIQDEKFYCPDCRPVVLRPGPVCHVYKFHPASGQNAHNGADIPEHNRKAFHAQLAEAGKFDGEYYWHRFPGTKEFTRVEIVNFKFAHELIGQSVVSHDTFIPEII